MTVGIVWIEKSGDGETLWFASDSRLSGDGNTWDTCPKLMPLPRRDAVAAFAGATAQAYPLLLQMANAIRGFIPAEDGTLDFLDVVGHLERVTNALMEDLEVDPLVVASEAPGEFRSSSDVIVLGGFSRKLSGFAIFRLRYARDLQAWRFGKIDGQQQTIGPNKPFCVYGDRSSAPRVAHFLETELRASGKLSTDLPFSFEPLRALWRYLELPTSDGVPVPADHRARTVGGAPQVIITRAGGTAIPVAVRWRGGDFVLGRRRLPYEGLTIPLVEGDAESSLKLVAPGKWEPDDDGQADTTSSGV